MGYTTIAYCVDLDRLSAARGSRDEALLTELEQRFAHRLAQWEETNAAIEPPPITLREALRRIVMDELSNRSDEAAEYVYAYELLCEHLGRALDGREHIKFLDDLEWETALLEFRTPLDLPPIDPFPTTGYLTPDEVRSEYDRFQDYDSDKDEDSDESEPWLVDARDEFVWWLQQCADEGSALVTFTY